jgi:hypothetical protein
MQISNISIASPNTSACNHGNPLVKHMQVKARLRSSVDDVATPSRLLMC